MTEVLFRAKQSSSGFQLWATDGTTSGTKALKDSSGNYVDSPLYLTALGNGEMIFSAFDSTNGQELWLTDGTSGGTALLKNIYPGSIDSSPGANTHSIAYLGSGTHKALFAADDGTTNITELWVTNGTANGTYFLQDTTNNAVPTKPYDIAVLGNGKALFDAQDGVHGDELWVTDGTNAGTSRLTDIYPGGANSYPRYITPIGGGKTLFAATDGNVSGRHGNELWITDGTAGGTQMVKDLNTVVNGNGGTDSSDPHGFAALGNGEVLFSADTGSGDQLWITDGTSTNTTLLLDSAAKAVPTPTEITPLGNAAHQALFIADEGTGPQLWVTDGSSGGTMRLKDNGGNYVSAPTHLTQFGTGKALFGAGAEKDLWVTDGTAGGTVQLTDGSITGPSYITPIGGGEALFQADYQPVTDGLHNYGIELFVTDGTSSGTKLLDNIYPDTVNNGNVTTTGSSYPGRFAVLQPLCFCRGTRIAAEHGEVAVEELRVGDKVQTLAGALKPIVWIGIGRDLVTRANKLARPIVVRRGALADNVPQRDLHLTHGHALYLEGALIPVENLVNHRSIVWDDTAQAVEYFHVELADHDVVLAEGAPAETYYDASNRALFRNSRPGSVPGSAKPSFAPVLNGGDLVDRVWTALAERAGALLPKATTEDPDLHVVVDGDRHEPASSDDCVFSFVLDGAPAAALWLRSRRGVPSLVGVNPRDHRQVGVAVKCILLSQAGVETRIDHDAPVLRNGGCHPAENGYCWTDGDLELPARLFSHLRGTFTVTVQIERPGMRYPVPAAFAAAA